MREALLGELDRVRQQGFSISVSERNMGIASVAAPIFGPEGQTLAAIAVIGTVDRIGEEKARQLSIEVRRAALAITDTYRSL